MGLPSQRELQSFFIYLFEICECFIDIFWRSVVLMQAALSVNILNVMYCVTPSPIPMSRFPWPALNYLSSSLYFSKTKVLLCDVLQCSASLLTRWWQHAADSGLNAEKVKNLLAVLQMDLDNKVLIIKRYECGLPNSPVILLRLMISVDACSESRVPVLASIWMVLVH